MTQDWIGQHPSANHTFPVLRDQIYQLQGGKYFLVAGTVPTGEISGQYLKSFIIPATQVSYLAPMTSPPPFRSQQRGSGWDTLLKLEDLAMARRTLVYRTATSKEILYQHKGLTYGTPSGPDVRRTCPPQVAEAADWLKQQGMTPEFMSSDAGFHLQRLPPSAAWKANPQAPSNITASVIAVAKDWVSGQSKPLLAFVVTGIEKIRLATPFLGELVGALLMAYLRSCFSHPIQAYMDCLSAIKSIKAGWKSKDPKDRAYGLLVKLIRHATPACQPPLQHTEAHPERPRKPTSTRPGRSTIPRDQWTLQNHINVLADIYSAPKLPPFRSPMDEPALTVTMTAFDLLNGFMPLGWEYWQHAGIPTVNPLGISTLRAERYLAKREAAGSHYPPGYWTSSELGLLPLVSTE
jgi:hypothetical protein